MPKRQRLPVALRAVYLRRMDPIDLYVRFADRDECAVALALLVAEPDERLAVDVIGDIAIIHQPAEIDDEGNELTPANIEILPGFHVNIRVLDDRDISSLEPWLVNPENPVRVWA